MFLGCNRISDGVEVGAGEGFTQLQLALSPEVIVRLPAVHDFKGQVGGGHPPQQRIRLEHCLLLLPQDGQIASVIHAPDPFLADLANEPLESRSLKVLT